MMNVNMDDFSVVIVAAGRGSRMGTDIPKQFLLVDGKPLLCYSIKAFALAGISEVILVTSKDYISYCEEMIPKYGLNNVKSVVEGGDTRYESVYAGLKNATGKYVMVHDGARPCIDKETIDRLAAAVIELGNAVAAVPVKDTIKVADADNVVVSTPRRDTLWSVQTPQCFETATLTDAYDKMFKSEAEGEDLSSVTDDAMVVETYLSIPVHLVMGSYENIKITTPEDLRMIEGRNL